jgi:hypothetical protein
LQKVTTFLACLVMLVMMAPYGSSPHEGRGGVSFVADRADGSGAQETVMAKGQKRSAEPKKWAV